MSGEAKDKVFLKSVFGDADIEGLSPEDLARGALDYTEYLESYLNGYVVAFMERLKEMRDTCYKYFPPISVGDRVTVVGKPGAGIVTAVDQAFGGRWLAMVRFPGSDREYTYPATVLKRS